MNVKEITASFGGTVNLGNYENFKIDLSVTVETEESDTDFDVTQLTQHLFDTVRTAVRDEVAKLDSRNVRGWLRDTDLKAEKAPESAAHSGNGQEDDS